MARPRSKTRRIEGLKSDRQGRSWFKATEEINNKTLLGRIFFPTNQYHLDTQDRRALNDLTAFIGKILKTDRVCIELEGHADYRGAEKFNSDLSTVRGTSIENYIKAKLGSNSNLKVRTVGFGESRSTINLMESRRVDIVAYSPSRTIRVPPIEIEGKIPKSTRIVYRKWSRFACVNTGRPPMSSGEILRQEEKKLINGILRALLGGKVAWVWGNEDKKVRKNQLIPVSYAVNQVDMHKSYSKNVKGFAECEFWDFDVNYHWGPPNPKVTINVYDEATMLGRKVRELNKTTSVSRAEADASQILTPPASKK